MDDDVQAAGSGESIFASLIPEEEYARQRGKSLRQIRRERSAGKGPKVVWLGRTPFYRPESIREWVLSQEREPSSCPPVFEPRIKRAPRRARSAQPRTPAAASGRVCKIEGCTAPVVPKDGPGPRNKYCAEHLPLKARHAAKKAAQP